MLSRARALVALAALVLLMPAAAAQPPPPLPPEVQDLVPAECVGVFPLYDAAQCALVRVVIDMIVLLLYTNQVLDWVGCDVVGGPACL